MKTNIYRLLVITLSLAGFAFLGVSSGRAQSSGTGSSPSGCGCGGSGGANNTNSTNNSNSSDPTLVPNSRFTSEACPGAGPGVTNAMRLTDGSFTCVAVQSVP